MSILQDFRSALSGVDQPQFEANRQQLVRNQKMMVALLALIDGGIVIVATFVAVMLRGVAPLGFLDSVLPNVAPIARWIPVAWLLALGLAGSYNYKRLGSGMDEYHSVLMGSFATLAALGVGSYLLSYELSRGFFVLLFLVGIPMLLLGRALMRRATNKARSKGMLGIKTILAGSDSHVDDLLKVLRRETWLGYDVVGLLLPHGTEDRTSRELPVLGSPDEAVDVIRETGAAAVIFTDGSFTRAYEFNQLARDLEELDAQTIIVPALADVCASRVRTRPVAGIPLVYVERPYAARAGSWGKRVFDIIGSLAVLLLVSPLLAVVALLIYGHDRGPVVFRQTRVGKNGKEFTLYKLRSMVVNADELTKELAARSDGNGVMFKMRHDPRITPIGHFIRRYSIDELPQLFNVLKGDMSLIGPRPALPCEVDAYEEHVLRRLAVRPGLSGLWQVSGRSDLSWEDTVRLDLYYVDNWSMVQDMVIVLRTVGAVLRPNGAY